MQIATPVFSSDAINNDALNQETLDAHSQAIERTIQIMHTHLHEVLTLEDLASVAYLSPYHFNRVFRRLIGIPPGEFLSALRFQAARRLLLTTALSVTDICFEVGYTSTGSFTTRFTQLVGLPPRLLRQRAHTFEPSLVAYNNFSAPTSSYTPLKNTLMGRISVPATFRGTIYIGLFSSFIPQGMPLHCTRLSSSGLYLLDGVPDGIYYLRAAAFPIAEDVQSCLLPGKKMLVGSNTGPLIIQNGCVSGDPDLIMHPPQLTDPPLVMGLPLL